jgi:hypothetical protein
VFNLAPLAGKRFGEGGGEGPAAASVIGENNSIHLHPDRLYTAASLSTHRMPPQLDWPLAIDRNRDVLKRIIAALFALVGLSAGGSVFTVPRHIHAAVMLVLRPAESAVRRLIVIAAHGLVLKQRASRPLPAGLPAVSAAGEFRTPAFCLFDQLKHFDLDDFNHSAGAIPHNSYFSFYDEDVASPQYFLPDEPVDATTLFTRLRALRHALNDLPKQARRLARWQARRDILLRSKRPFRPMRLSPIRPGPPPGRRLRSIHEVDDVLRECHGLARDMMNSS